ncbi:dephospho-CoA kinase [Anaerorhabdus sp.]|uniref:dephospho-CoA kinase n=1 Tax=Anaerorhabdus sp. TaxID=1872524 RepID=UPI002FCB210B
MKKVAITGTIGSGKTECSHLIESMGYTVFNCDDEVNQLYLQDDSAIEKLKTIFPFSYHNGIWDKRSIANEIFKENTKKIELENIIYPVLLKKMQDKMIESKEVFFAEVPLLFQTGWDQYFDEILLVTCDDDIAMKRLITNRGMSEEDARRRLHDQKKHLLQIERATKIIYNNNNIEDLKKQVREWVEMEIIGNGTKR